MNYCANTEIRSDEEVDCNNVAWVEIDQLKLRNLDESILCHRHTQHSHMHTHTHTHTHAHAHTHKHTHTNIHTISANGRDCVMGDTRE